MGGVRGWRGSPRNEDLASLAKFDKFNAYANMQLLMSFHAHELSTHCTDFSNNNKFLKGGGGREEWEGGIPVFPPQSVLKPCMHISLMLDLLLVYNIVALNLD